jgi:hypothetical protein
MYDDAELSCPDVGETGEWMAKYRRRCRPGHASEAHTLAYCSIRYYAASHRSIMACIVRRADSGQAGSVRRDLEP